MREPEIALDGLCATGTDGQSYYATGMPDQSLLCAAGLATGFIYTTGGSYSGAWTWTCMGTGL